ncbi:type II toxin-antitoxin system RelE/ParE family toxin [Methylobacterium sp. ap11]|uniref:type II toxin-antitoxin system RelE/ParE family toxin n=1 Tax=Methylobacterium sp. ap11 TaxID=1761799 RepID=UPI001FCDCF5F|nr:type II toxin-antitoxin system RelE/ParE family toxin [Methylobacterium sp. ap11]
MKGALKAFEGFPTAVQDEILDALTLVADGGLPDTAKPFKGVGSGVFEIAIRHRGDAYRSIYAVQIADAVWVIDAFQKKSTRGIKTPQVDVERIKQRLKRVQEALR